MFDPNICYIYVKRLVKKTSLNRQQHKSFFFFFGGGGGGGGGGFAQK